MLAYCILFALVAATVRLFSQSLSSPEIVFFRTTVIFLAMLVWHRRGLRNMKTHRLGMHLARAVAATLATLALFHAFTVIPIAEATAITFTAPLFTTIGAMIFFKEKPRASRLLATAVSFAGMIIILRPGSHIFDPGSLYALAGALLIAVNLLLISSLAKTESANAIVLYNAMLMTPMSLAVALFFWQAPSWAELAGLLLLGALATGLQHSVTRAFGQGQTTAILPLDFTRLIFAALLGWFLFDEAIGPWVLLGGALIFVSTVTLMRHEAKPLGGRH
ncbi:MAG: DMT family transporter [Desulfarculaceae bacterium]|nr:DMT family transporter [Desulfarculaceae bacterium]